MKETTTLTREELYELVWTTPMSRLTAEYAISDVGLKKLCARHNTPTPPRGYWAQRDAGKAPARPKLRASKHSSPIQLRVATTDERVAMVPDALALAITEAKRPENRISVPDRLRSPSEPVREAKELLKNITPNALGLLECPSGCLDIQVSRGQLPRALRIADALVKAFERRGWDIAVQSEGTFVHVDDVPIALAIVETLETFELPPEPELTGSYSFHYNRREVVRRPSGDLTVAIRETPHLWHHSQQRNWRGVEKRALEKRLTDVVVGMLKLSFAVKADLDEKERRALEEQERKRQVQAPLDEQERLRAALAQEQARVELLIGQAGRWRESQSVRLFIEEARKRGRIDELGIEGDALAQWLTWATEQADDDEDEEEDAGHRNAVELALMLGHLDILKQKKLRAALTPGCPESSRLIEEACHASDSHPLSFLLGLGHVPGQLPDHGTTAISWLLHSMSWDFSFERSSVWSSASFRPGIDSDRARELMKMLHIIVAKGARWLPADKRAIGDARRCLLKMAPPYVLEFAWLMQYYKAARRRDVRELLRTPAMIRLLLKEHDTAASIVAGIPEEPEQTM